MQTPKTHRLLKRVVQVWAVICGTYFMWEALNYRGLFGRLAELQIAYFGSYAPLLTYLFLFSVAVVPALIILRLVTGRGEQEEHLPRLVEKRIVQAHRIRTALGVLFAAVTIVAIAFAVFTIWMLPKQDGPVQTISASEVTSLQVREGPARLVGGELGLIIFFGQDWYLADDRMAFSPYRPVVTKEGLAHVFVQLEAKNRTDLVDVVQRPAWSGIIVKGGLPGTVRVLFKSLGVGAASPYYTLYKDEQSLKIRYWLQAIQWAILAVFLGLLIALQTRKIRHLLKQQEEIASRLQPAVT